MPGRERRAGRHRWGLALRRSRVAHPRGLTLVELLVTAAIAAVALLAIATVFPVAMSNIDAGAEETAALAITQGFTEMMRGLDWTTLHTFNGFDSKRSSACPATPTQVKAVCDSWVDQIAGNSTRGIQGLAAGQATVTIVDQASVNTNSLAQLATVTVTVSYTARHAWLINPRRQIVLVTRKTQG
jgi:prepilin-type N-terminal cleavage/methylation domain-containing protein